MRRGLPALMLLAMIPLHAAATRPQLETRFSVERLHPPAGGAGLTTCESARIPGHRAVLLHVLTSIGHAPLALRASGGHSAITPVRQVASLHLSAAAELWRQVRVGVQLPVLLLAGDRLRSLGQARGFPAFLTGDLRIQATISMHADQASILAVALSAVLTLPTGDSDNFAGTGTAGFEPRILVLFQPGEHLDIYARAGAELLERREFFGTAWGSRITWGVGARLEMPWIPIVGPRLRLFAEVDGASCAGCASTPPVEARIGFEVHRGGWRMAIGAGPGIGDGATVPSWRILGSTGVTL